MANLAVFRPNPTKLWPVSQEGATHCYLMNIHDDEIYQFSLTSDVFCYANYRLRCVQLTYRNSAPNPHRLYTVDRQIRELA